MSLPYYPEKQLASHANLVFSPHIDDAFLSLGGMLAKDSAKRQKIVDVFSISGFAPRGGCPKGDVDCVTKARKSEEQANCEVIGADVEFLPLSDSEVRGYSKKTFPRFESERELIAKAKEEIRHRLGAQKVFFPLAIGRHVDHMIVNRIGLELIIEEHILLDTFFYEDLPYSASRPRRYSMMDLTADRGSLESTLVSFPWKKKWDLCRSYQSQFSDKVYRRILRYAKGIKPFGSFYERIWQIKSEDYARSLLVDPDRTGVPKNSPF